MTIIKVLYAYETWIFSGISIILAIVLWMKKQHGDKKLPEFQNFLTLWITYLGTKTAEYIMEANGELGLLEKRVEGIMNANRRNYYRECAAYIAASGEVRELLGEMLRENKRYDIFKFDIKYMAQCINAHIFLKLSMVKYTKKEYGRDVNGKAISGL